MQSFIFNVNFHLTILAIGSLLVYAIYISGLAIKNAKKIEAIKKLANQNDWTKIPIIIEKTGFFIENEYLNRYSKVYPTNLSEVQIIQAASFEFESLKQRIKKRQLEITNGGVTIFYRTKDGKLKNKITVSNNAESNYKTLMSIKGQDFAYQNKHNNKIIVLSMPSKEEIKFESNKLHLDLVKKGLIYGFFAASISIAAVLV